MLEKDMVRFLNDIQGIHDYCAPEEFSRVLRRFAEDRHLEYPQ